MKIRTEIEKILDEHIKPTDSGMLYQLELKAIDDLEKLFKSYALELLEEIENISADLPEHFIGEESGKFSAINTKIADLRKKTEGMKPIKRKNCNCAKNGFRQCSCRLGTRPCGFCQKGQPFVKPTKKPKEEKECGCGISRAYGSNEKGWTCLDCHKPKPKIGVSISPSEPSKDVTERLKGFRVGKMYSEDREEKAKQSLRSDLIKRVEEMGKENKLSIGNYYLYNRFNKGFNQALDEVLDILKEE